MSNLTMLGEWSGEPDLLEFEALGFKCKVMRNTSLGHLCGYIAIGADHPWHGKCCSEIDADVHGGLTYCKDGEVGFDCAHAGDLVPKMSYLQTADLGETYKGLGFVVGELISLAKQAKEAVK